MAIQSFRDLIVWQKAMKLVAEIYKITKQLPASEVYGLASQMQRAAVSIPSNIAEGCARNNRPEYRQFCGISQGSAAELETRLLFTTEIYPKIHVSDTLDTLHEVQKMLRSLISKLTTIR